MTTRTAHTPGPWTVKTVDTVIGHAHKIIPLDACVYVDHQHLPFDASNEISRVALADAQLLAAAPELLEALKDATKMIDVGNAGFLTRLEQLIAKAEGRG